MRFPLELNHDRHWSSTVAKPNQSRHPRESGDPVTYARAVHAPAVRLETPPHCQWNTGCPAYAGHDRGEWLQFQRDPLSVPIPNFVSSCSTRRLAGPAACATIEAAMTTGRPPVGGTRHDGTD